MQIAGLLLVVLGFGYQATFNLRLGHRLFRRGNPYTGIPPSHLDKTAWLAPILWGTGLLLLSSGGLFTTGKFTKPFLFFGSLSCVFGLWLGYRREFILFGEIQFLAQELTKDRKRPREWAEALEKRAKELGGKPLFAKEQPYTAERHLNGLRPSLIVIVFNVLALIACALWSRQVTGEDQKFYIQVSVVLGLCLIFLCILVLYFVCLTPKK